MISKSIVSERTITGILLLFGGFLLPQCQKKEKSDNPNIVFIFADDLGYGDVSSLNPYSRTLTPNIDKLIAEGLLFTDAHSAGALCIPSRYSLLTGRYYFRVPESKEKQYRWGYRRPDIEPGRKTIGNIMQESGYTTACIGKWHEGLNWKRKDIALPLIENLDINDTLGYTNTNFSLAVNGGPNDIGFDYSYIKPGSLDMPPYVFLENQRVIDTNIISTAEIYPKKLKTTVYEWDRIASGENDIYLERGVWWWNGEISESFKLEDCLDTIVAKGISFIENESKKNNPFFLYLPLTAPHDPWLPNSDFTGKTSLGRYGDFIAQTDYVIYSVNIKLKELGIDKNTMIIFASDNGAMWNEEDTQKYGHNSSWGRRGMKGDAWDGGHHVPLVIKWPGKIKKGSIYRETVSLIDFYATLADLTGKKIKSNEAEDSFSFMSVLNGNLKKPTRDHAVSVARHPDILAVKKGNWKYINGLGSGGMSDPAYISPLENGPQGQLYNLEIDPLESNNLYLQEPEKVNDLVEFLDKVMNCSYR